MFKVSFLTFSGGIKMHNGLKWVNELAIVLLSMCSKLTINTNEQHQMTLLVSLLLTLNTFIECN